MSLMILRVRRQPQERSGDRHRAECQDDRNVPRFHPSHGLGYAPPYSGRFFIVGALLPVDTRLIYYYSAYFLSVNNI